MKRSERNFFLDIVLFTTFLATSITGLVIWVHMRPQPTLTHPGYHHESWLISHICMGLASVMCVVIHVIWHKRWLAALRGRSMASLPLKLKANRILDRIIWISFLNASVFGGLSLAFPGSGDRVGILSRLHVASGIFLLVGIIVHLVFHRKWIVASARRYLLSLAVTMENLPKGFAKE